MALREVERALNEEGVETEQFFIGNEALPDCIACRKCREMGRCVFNDVVNEFVEKAKSAIREGCLKIIPEEYLPELVWEPDVSGYYLEGMFQRALEEKVKIIYE